MNLYSQEVREFIHSRDWPSGVKFEIRQNDEPAPHLNIVFYRDNWLTLDYQAQLKITEIVKEVMHKLHADGIPTYVGKIERAED